MIQSPRGLINVTAQSSFPLQFTENYIHQDSDTSSTSSSQINNTETDNQPVWSNPIRNTLNPQIARQLSYSYTLLIMAQSAGGIQQNAFKRKNSQSKDGRHKHHDNQQQYKWNTRTNHTRCEHKEHERQWTATGKHITNKNIELCHKQHNFPRILHTPTISKQRYLGHKHRRVRTTKWNTVTQRFISERGKSDTGVSSDPELVTKH